MTDPNLSLPEAVAGHVERWRWEAGLDPAAVSTALGASVAPGPILHQGQSRQAASLQLANLQWPLWAVWETGGDLVLIETVEPPEAPTADEALATFGEPDARVDRTGGAYPGYEQLVYLRLGFTLFVSGPGRPAYQWLYQPTDFNTYAARTGATVAPTRLRR